MRTNRILLTAATAVTFAVTAGIASQTGPALAARVSPAETAIQAAAKQKRYALVTFYKKNDTASAKMLADAKKLQAKYSSRASFVTVDVGSAANHGIISRYGVDQSPAPLTLVIAPNGAITAGYPRQLKTTDLSDAFVSEGMANVLKALQGGNLAAVCLLNSRTKHNKESLAAAEGLQYDAQFKGAVEVFKIDPADRSELKFVKQCAIDPATTNAQIIVFAPPGRIVGKFDGTTTTRAISAALLKSIGSGCGGGSCGPSGCGP